MASPSIGFSANYFACGIQIVFNYQINLLVTGSLDWRRRGRRMGEKLLLLIYMHHVIRWEGETCERS